MLARTRALLAVATSQGKHTLRTLGVSQFASLTRDVAEANRELDEFFGVSTTTTTSSSSSAGRHVHNSDGDGPIPERPFATRGRERHSAPVGVDSLNPGWDVAPGYGFAATAEQDRYGMSAQQPPPPQQQQQQQPQPQVQQLPPLALTHIDATGSASMVDVSQKAVTVREAQASCAVSLGAAFDLVAANSVSKGDVLVVAQLAGICGAKATATLIPLCHNIPISKVDVQLHLDAAARAVVVRALARTDGKTGVEMEALTAASVAALTVYDMCKAAAKDMVVGALQLDYKSGGRSGTYLRAGLTRADLLPSARPPL
ncbi:Cyclic pyranopterin monophosphate synthase, mitochondrial [Pleodorina starrii]|uniref:cyclic pyranopterin monophosphate synthase n=1 Tax=Pleodorina starrii TaxID=330485 RepID=A0A9W6EYN3_9CHLO|nr:Cyclic pyranopterin monophosphate synthase [Pleodorina starrii]GLC49709.1 Cyclic pyranopterin monophosphate synthase, mitochondrial [Pleodorina starrii]GLC76010.1 Cyclic pyranopterin monophosphate synthase [Pleodorina starrii]